jgi:hypothetical protein
MPENLEKPAENPSNFSEEQLDYSCAAGADIHDLFYSRAASIQTTGAVSTRLLLWLTGRTIVEEGKKLKNATAHS